MINDDTLDLVNTQDSVVKHCYFRTQDDNIAIKRVSGLIRPCENIFIKDSVLWLRESDDSNTKMFCYGERGGKFEMTVSLSR